MVLEALLRLFGHARKFNAHSNSRVASANHGAGRNTLLIDPQIHAKRGGHGQGHHGLNITAVAADVGGINPERSVHTLIAEFHRDRNFLRLSCRCCVRSSAFMSAGSAAIHGQSWSITSCTPTWVFLSTPASTTQATLQRALRVSYCTPIT